ncbi:MAG: aspartate aminotransferase family protein [Burkholderiales bacterium]|nr:aspartate aminotransferase family protein [Burkholderiales bacterium]
MTDADAIKHLWTHKTQDHPHLPDEALLFERGQGIYVWNREGRRFIDAFAGLAVVNAGHGRPEIAEAIAKQAQTLAYYPTTRQFSNRPAAELAAKLAELTPGDLKYTLFAVSGSEANERSIQIARHYWLKAGRPRKYKVIALERGYHGATLGTLEVCGIPELFQAYAPLAWPGFVKSPAPYPLRDRALGSDEQIVRRCAEALADAVLKEDPETVAAVILEPCLSSGGVIIPPLGWLERVRDVCDELDVLMIADEVITGFGRTGKWFAVEHEAVVPDLMSVAKGITSGYVPLSASIARSKLAEVFAEDSRDENVHPNTYCGHPLACAAALANIAILERENLVENSARMGERLQQAIERRIGGLPIVGEVRSRGLLLAVDLVDPQRKGQALAREHVASLDMRAWQRGVIPFARGSVLRLAPPLCIDAAQVDELAALMCECVEELQDAVSAQSKNSVATGAA